MKSKLYKDKVQRKLFKLNESRIKVTRSFFENQSLSRSFRYKIYLAIINKKKHNSIARLNNRCLFTNRPRAILRDFKMSRLMFRKLASAGLLMGVKKASW